MVCLHRYCAKCIEQYLRAKVPGRCVCKLQECCLTSLPTRRSSTVLYGLQDKGIQQQLASCANTVLPVRTRAESIACSWPEVSGVGGASAR
jgi:hypothetical protein